MAIGVAQGSEPRRRGDVLIAGIVLLAFLVALIILPGLFTILE